MISSLLNEIIRKKPRNFSVVAILISALFANFFGPVCTLILIDLIEGSASNQPLSIAYFASAFQFYFLISGMFGILFYIPIALGMLALLWGLAWLFDIQGWRPGALPAATIGASAGILVILLFILVSGDIHLAWLFIACGAATGALSGLVYLWVLGWMQRPA
jgi:hypothetical protein